jgi:methylated-DNA-[protein]-cysteine S-methyltransferase
MSLVWARFTEEAECQLVLVAELMADGGALREIRFGSEAPAGGLEDGEHAVLKEAARQLRAYFAGELREFDLPLKPAGTAFQQRVWHALLSVRYGETRSYGEIAKEIGADAAVRAVGAANGRNPIPIVIPCHRIIGAGGKLTGFGGGLPLKKFLLDLERSQAGLDYFPSGMNSLHT